MVDRSSPLPAYFQISRALRARISSGEWKPGSQLPAEPELARQYAVSRMTMRQAIQELVREGTLSRRRGSGTFVNLSFVELLGAPAAHAAEAISQRALQLQEVYARLREVALPDARHHWDFSLFFPDFTGNDLCVQALCQCEVYRTARVVFIAPDNSLTLMRQRALQDGKTVMVPTAGIARGFRLFEPGSVPPGQEPFSALMDGMERYSRAVSLEEIGRMKIDLMVSGLLVITPGGMRWGHGYGYFDLEWGIFRLLGAVAEETPVAAIGHDCQVVELEDGAAPSESETLADWIITPTRLIHTRRSLSRPNGVIWKQYSPELITHMRVLKELKDLLDTPAQLAGVQINTYSIGGR